MSSIVADELAKIKSFETETEKRRSELTLNELNYISDKQLHKKDNGGGGGSGPVEWDFLAELVHDGGEFSANLLAGDYYEFREKIESETDEILNVGALARLGEYLRVTVMVELGSPGEDYLGFIVLVGEKAYIVRWFSDNTLTVAEDGSDPGVDAH